ncbi:helix-turn-helix domain-containing protein [Paenibacillus sp.]|uniref:helix-turn-helix domain-containing protein n=1 Tax=Paenibacillus sp. TaxID=58172 RepID=UPI002D49CFBC|nr:helix-turn-helix domain-containing protein [Paenibacillus sp.]HZG57929.1 helix-turn-helix domain-containing protein [Paenibacillus sp.]
MNRVSPYLLRLILFGSLLSLLPVMFIGAFAYYKASEDVQAKVVERNGQLVRQTQARVDQVLELVEQSVVQFADSPLSKTALRSPLTPEDFVLLNELRSELSGLQKFNLGVTDIHYVNWDKGWYVDNVGWWNPFDREGALSYLEQERSAGSPPWELYEGSLGAGQPESCHFLLLKRLPYLSNAPRGAVASFVSCGHIDKLINEVVYNGLFFVTDERGRIVAANREAAASPRALQAAYDELSVRGGTAAEVSVGGERHLVTRHHSPYTDWTYVLLTPQASVLSESETIRRTAISLCSGILLMCFVLATVGSRRLYDPIRRLQDMMRGESREPAKPRAKNEFITIQEGILDLMNHRKRMTAEMQGQMRRLNHYFVVTLIQEGMRAQDIAEQLRKFDYPKDWKRWAVLVADVERFEETSYPAGDRSLLMFAMQNIAMDMLSPSQRLHPVLMGKYQVTIMADHAEDGSAFERNLLEFAKLFQGNVLSYLKLNVSVGISRVYTRLEDTPKAYKEALEALKYRIKLGHRMVLPIDELEGSTTNRLEVPEKLSGDIIDLVKLGYEEEVMGALEVYFDALFAEERTPLEYQFLLSQLVIGIWNQLGDPVDAEHDPAQDGRSALTQLFELSTKQEIKSWLRDVVVLPAARRRNQRETAHSVKLCQDVKRLVHERYDSDLTLEACSELLNYHPNYIRRVFKQHVGVNFSEYLADYRMERAKYWLSKTDMKIFEIAEKLKYQNSQNFIRSFRKSVGMTPGEYREKHADA